MQNNSLEIVTGSAEAAKKVEDIKSSIDALKAELDEAEKACVVEQEPYNKVAELEDKLSDEKAKFDKSLADEKEKFEIAIADEKEKFEKELASMAEKAVTKQNTIVQNRVLIEKNRTLALELKTIKDNGGDGSDYDEDATDLTEALDSANTEIVTITEELSVVKEELVGALSRESKLVDDISELTSVKDEFDNSDHDGEPCDKCENAVEEIDGLKVNEGRLHEENEELLKQLEESLDDNTNMIQRMNFLKEEIKILQCENSKAEAGEDM